MQFFFVFGSVDVLNKETLLNLKNISSLYFVEFYDKSILRLFFSLKARGSIHLGIIIFVSNQLGLTIPRKKQFLLHRHSRVVVGLEEL